MIFKISWRNRNMIITYYLAAATASECYFRSFVFATVLVTTFVTLFVNPLLAH